MGLLDNFDSLTDSAKQYALNALARFGNGVGNTVQQIPGNAQRLAQGLLNLPHDISQTFSSQPGGLLSPQLGQQINQAMSHPQPANPAQWMDQGMALAGMAPVTAPIGMFIGKGAKTWDAIAAQKAAGLLDAGHDPRQVWQQTGTMRGVDGHLRQEIPDNAARMLNPDEGGRLDKMIAADPSSKGLNGIPQAMSLDDVLSHPELDRAYFPVREDAPSVMFDSLGKTRGSYSPDSGGVVTLNNANVLLDEPAQRSTLLHELQHGIQYQEGWSTGGNPNSAAQQIGGDLADFYSPQEKYDLYRRLAGEAEARLTQARMNLTPEQRLQHYPYDPGPYGLDVPQSQLIVRTR